MGQLMELFPCRMRRKFNRGLKRKPMALIKKLRKKKRECPANEKPDVVKTHLRNMVIVPEMTGSMVGVYNGKTLNQVEIKPEMIGHYLGEFSITYKPVKHGRPGIGATHSCRTLSLARSQSVVCLSLPNFVSCNTIYWSRFTSLRKKNVEKLSFFSFYKK